MLDWDIHMKLYQLMAGASVAVLAAAPAFAQSTPTADECAADATLQGCTTTSNPGDIIVTGSRIARPNLDAPVPVTSVVADKLLETGNTSLGDMLNQLPMLRSTYSQANSTRAIGIAGLNLIDLRGLGTSRTLVVVNGRRHVTSTPGGYAVDVNTIPTQLLERVDIVTGGNSAIYGSDAVSGVVNFILRRDYEGFEARAQAGVSSRGDRGSQSISAVWGRNFADGRGNIAISGEFSHQDTVLFADRPDQTGAFNGPPGYYTTSFNADEKGMGNGIPDLTFFGPNMPGSRFGTYSLGGTVTTVCPAAAAGAIVAARIAAVCTGKRGSTANGPGTGGLLSDNYVFLPNGQLVRDHPDIDLREIGGGRFGGLTGTGVEGAMLLPGLRRYAGNLLFHYEFSPAVEFFAEAKYVNITNNQTGTTPTFVNGTLSPNFRLDNPFLTEDARNTIRTIMGYAPGTANYNSGAFTMNRFNNDIGTRAENHERQTYRIVAGLRGQIAETGNLRYELFGNFGRTSTYYETGGNVDVARFNRASQAVRNAAGQIVCAVNADSNTANDDPACRPINLFGEGAPMRTTPDGVDYVSYTSWRKQWAKQLNFVGFISGDSSGLFELPGGPIGFSIGGEYRREDAYSDYDDYTQSGATFLNGFATFNPPAITVKEAFAELRVPLLSERPFFHDLAVEASARMSDYSNADKAVWAYNYGVSWAPVQDIRFRVGWARSVRAPDLGDVYGAAAQTFANGFVDPCNQGTPINSNPNRARNCAAAGIPTTITLSNGQTVPWVNNPTSGISGVIGGNPGLHPEIGRSFTAGTVIQPRFIPGLTVTIDYYRIKIREAINSLSGQQIVNRCYDDPVGLDNPFCDAVVRRTSADPMINGTLAGQNGRRFDGLTDINLAAPITPGFYARPFNFAQLRTSGIDFDANYTREIGTARVNLRGLISWVEKREFFTYITDPSRSDRQHGVLGDPRWQGQFSASVQFPRWDFSYDLRYVGRQTVYSWETQFSHQGRQPTNGDVIANPWYPAMWYHDIQVGFCVTEGVRFYVGVDNVTDKLPPLGATGTGAGSGIWPVTGRYFYSGFRVRM